MAGVVNYTPAPSLFHAWQHSLDQSQGTKEVHFKQFLAMSTGTHSIMANNATPALLTVERQRIFNN